MNVNDPGTRRGRLALRAAGALLAGGAVALTLALAAPVAKRA